MSYFSKYNYTIIRKHWLKLVFKYLKITLLILLAVILYYISYLVIDTNLHILRYYIFFPAIFLLVNYAFIKLILLYIKFFNDLLIVHNGQLIVVSSSLFFKDNIEFIDINKITKLDIYCKGFIPNVFGFGNLVVEQQRDEVREFYYIPKPFKALQILKNQKEHIIEDRKNTYVHNVENSTKF